MNTKTHTVLARKYRPMTFADVVGQEHVKNAIKNSIASDKLHSVYLLSGTRGIGKTTIARIFAKAMNCENYEQNHEPCGTCESCESFKHDGNPGIVEIDAASRSTVKDTREIIDFIDTPVMVGNYNVFIIDEVHMLSDSSFNALLKTLEEPPERVKFILCTTDPQKIPATVLSRCLHFHLRPITAQQIYDHLCKLLKIENVEFEERAIYLIAQLANGSLRDSLSLTDQAIALGNNNVTLKVVHAMVGMIDDSFANQVVVHLVNRNTHEAFQLVQKISRQQPDWKLLISQILDNLSNLTIVPLLPETEQLKFKLENEELYQLIQEHSSNRRILLEVAQILYDIFVHAVKLIDITSNPEQVMKLTIIRGLAFSSSAEYVGNLEVIWQEQQKQQAQESKKQVQPEVVKKSNRRAEKVLEAVTSAESYGSSIYNCRSLILLNSEQTSNVIDYTTILNSMQLGKTQNETNSNTEAPALSSQSVSASTENSKFTNSTQFGVDGQVSGQLSELQQHSHAEVNNQINIVYSQAQGSLSQPNNETVINTNPVLSALGPRLPFNLNNVILDLGSKDYKNNALLPAYLGNNNYKIVVGNVLRKVTEEKQDIVSLGFLDSVSSHLDSLTVNTNTYSFLPNIVSLYQNYRNKALKIEIIANLKNLSLTDDDLLFLFELPLKLDSQGKTLTLIVDENLHGIQEHVEKLKSKLASQNFQLQTFAKQDNAKSGEFVLIKNRLALELDGALSQATKESEEEAGYFAKLFEASLETIDLHE